MTGKVISINISARKGTAKKPVNAAEVRKNSGIVGDAHSGTNRQVSFISWETVKNWLKNKPKNIKINYGDFAENITTAGIDWSRAKVADIITVGENVKLEIMQVGKECHCGCTIREAVGDCIMPKQGIFAQVSVGGEIKTGDTIEVQID